MQVAVIQTYGNANNQMEAVAELEPLNKGTKDHLFWTNQNDLINVSVTHYAGSLYFVAAYDVTQNISAGSYYSYDPQLVADWIVENPTYNWGFSQHYIGHFGSASAAGYIYWTNCKWVDGTGATHNMNSNSSLYSCWIASNQNLNLESMSPSSVTSGQQWNCYH